MLLLLIPILLFSQGNDSTKVVSKAEKIVYKFDIKEMIAPAALRQSKAAFEQAKENKADLILIHMDTYGGAVDAANSIRTLILNSAIPVYVFIDNNAASAGALISIACDSIYMSPGASFGAATVVNQEGVPMPEKYQSYMRSTLRSTAEASGRDPRIAEAMNDARIYIEGVTDTGEVLTFTPKEAIANNYCEGEVKNIEEALAKAGIKIYKIVEYKKTSIESIIDILLNPALSGILIMIIIGGIYFELQSPGVGFPLIASITAAVLYFAPHYLQGLAENWEILLFIVGVILLMLEVFVIPGFGVAGILGIGCVILGLTLSLIGSVPSDLPIRLPEIESFAKAFFLVMLSIISSLGLSFYFGGKLVKSALFGHAVLQSTQQRSAGYISVDKNESDLVGSEAIAHTVLRPSGKIAIGENIYDATADRGFIEKGNKVKIIRFESAQLFVVKI